MTTVLVTGAAGFIGSHLAAALRRDADVARVVGIDCFDPFYDRRLKEANLAWAGQPRAGVKAGQGRIELIDADVCDGAAIREAVARVRPDAIYHLAALVGVRPSIDAADRYVAVNVGGLVSVLEAARHTGRPPVVFASSSSVYGNCAKVPFAEDDEPAPPVSPYAATKQAGELLCHAYAHLHGLRIACVRLFTVYGPRQRPDLAISRFFRAIAADQPIPMFGDGSTSRDYTYVDDIVRGVRAAATTLETAEPGFVRTWNLGGAHPVTLRELIGAVAAVTGRRPRIEQLPPQPGDVDRTFADLTRARAELGYCPRVELDEGLRRQWAWMRDEGTAAPRQDSGSPGRRDDPSTSPATAITTGVRFEPSPSPNP